MTAVLLPVVNGVAFAMLLFIVASGLTLIFGVMRVVNFAHGGFFALGAFLTFTLAAGSRLPMAEFALAAVGASLICAALGMVIEVVVFRRIYHLSHTDSLLATYAALLILQGSLILIWGNRPRSQPLPADFGHAVTLMGVQVASYNLLLIALGLLVAVFLWAVLIHTPMGRMVRAVASDRTMSAALGINVDLVFTGMFGLGVFLAGMGGALASPLFQLDSTLASTLVLESFAVVLVGGVGSVLGALIAALLLGLLNSFLVAFDPVLADFSLYIAMAVVLLLRPTGLLGSAAMESR
ncbi:MAG TPA: branched-chain amino acid ABC transporter permease [Candidatus Dormibacteraeota bacterium]|nr:branched-chain amino acid ABC transporter permease [Candidatus Dormibacteraeota bacterium]